MAISHESNQSLFLEGYRRLFDQEAASLQHLQRVISKTQSTDINTPERKPTLKLLYAKKAERMLNLLDVSRRGQIPLPITIEEIPGEEKHEFSENRIGFEIPTTEGSNPKVIVAGLDQLARVGGNNSMGIIKILGEIKALREPSLFAVKRTHNEVRDIQRAWALANTIRDTERMDYLDGLEIMLLKRFLILRTDPEMQERKIVWVVREIVKGEELATFQVAGERTSRSHQRMGKLVEKYGGYNEDLTKEDP